MNHKRKRPKNRRSGCLLCKHWKVIGFRTERMDGERYSDHRRRQIADEQIEGYMKSEYAAYRNWHRLGVTSSKRPI
jgi:hypothetical protein